MKDNACIVILGMLCPLMFHDSTNIAMLLTDFITKLTAFGVILKL